jgi:hypothetical protein
MKANLRRFPVRIVPGLLALAAVALLAPLLFTAGKPAPADASSQLCRGWVLYMNKDKAGVVRSTYSVYCDKKVDKIVLKAFMREGDRWSAMNTVTCRNTNICNNRESLKDRKGTQSYFVRAYEGDWPPSTYVQDNGNTRRCNAKGKTGFPCGGSGKKF